MINRDQVVAVAGIILDYLPLGVVERTTALDRIMIALETDVRPLVVENPPSVEQSAEDRAAMIAGDTRRPVQEPVTTPARPLVVENPPSAEQSAADRAAMIAGDTRPPADVQPPTEPAAVGVVAEPHELASVPTVPKRTVVNGPDNLNLGDRLGELQALRASDPAAFEALMQQLRDAQDNGGPAPSAEELARPEPAAVGVVSEPHLETAEGLERP